MNLDFDPLNPPYRSKLVSYTIAAALIVLVIVFAIMFFWPHPPAATPQRPSVPQFPATKPLSTSH